MTSAAAQAELDFTPAERAADLTGCFAEWWAVRRAFLAMRCPLCLTEALEARCKAYWTCRAYADACGRAAGPLAAESAG